MPRGEFITESGLIIPNQFTTVGMQQLLALAFKNTVPAAWLIGLSGHNPADALALAAVVEPTVGVNSYARQNMALQSAVNWPTIGTINGESYVESKAFTFTVTGGGYDVATNRFFITDATNIIAISSSYVDNVVKLLANMTTKYRLYFR